MSNNDFFAVASKILSYQNGAMKMVSNRIQTCWIQIRHFTHQLFSIIIKFCNRFTSFIGTF